MHTNLQQPQKLFFNPVRYEIPAFQRRYVWKRDEQWEPLWEDVESLAEAIVDGHDPEVHFMGAIVLQQSMGPVDMVGRRMVVDGQQRLTTLQLLIDAIQEVLEDRNHVIPAQQLASLVLNPEAFWDKDRDFAFKLWPTISDQDAFRHAMTNDVPTEDYPDQNHRIVAAHEFFKTQVKHWLDDFDGNKSTVAALALSRAVQHKLELVVIDLSASDDPHVIFETLNARGTPLLQSDMIKNKILYDAKIGFGDDGGREAKAIWPFDEDSWWSVEIGSGMQRRPRIDVFVNHWLTLRNQAEMKSYDEFRAFQKFLSARYGAGDTIQDIASDIRGRGDTWRDIERMRVHGIERFLQRRNVMKVGAVTPLLLWLLSANLNKGTLRTCLLALESFLVRRVLCGYGAKGYGKMVVGLLGRLDQTDPNGADRVIISFLKDQKAPATKWPDDGEVRDQLVSKPIFQWLTQGRIRMLLEAIEEHMMATGRWGDAEVPRKLQIEHVMPQKWRDHWPLRAGMRDREEATTDRDRMIHTIGNLTLVSPKLNLQMSNGRWSKKKHDLNKYAVLLLNKELVERSPDVWDEAAIERRSKRLHKRIVKIWPHADDILAE